MANRLDRLNRIKIYVNTLEAFKRIMRENPVLGAFCYVIATMGKPLYDPNKTFKKLSTKQHIKFSKTYTKPTQNPKNKTQKQYRNNTENFTKISKIFFRSRRATVSAICLVA